MKKIILLWFLFFGIYPTINQNTISFNTTQVCYAQNGSTAYSDPSGSGSSCEIVRQSIWDWLRNLWRAISGIATNIYEFLDDFFNPGGGNNPPPPPGSNTSSTPTLPTTWAVTFYGSAASVPQSPVFSGGGGGGYTPNSAVQNILEEEFPIPDPPVNDCEGILNGTAFLDDCGTCVGGYTGLIPCYLPPDCNGVPGGTAYRDSCNRCVGGNTGLLPCRIDTVKPVKIPCDTNAVKRDTLLTGILNSVENTPEMINLRDSASIRKFEVGFTVNRTVPNNVPVYVVKDYKKNGTARNVNLSLFTNTIAWVHAHPPFDSSGIHSVDGPSPMDVMGTIDNWSATTQRRFFAQYVISGDTNHHDYALSVADTSLLKQFYARYPYDSVIDLRDYIIKNGVSVLNLQKNNWRGDRNDANSFFGKFVRLVQRLREDKYPQQYLEDYANVILMKQYNMGVTMHRKVNGQFKEFSFATEVDAQGRLHYKIKICE